VKRILILFFALVLLTAPAALAQVFDCATSSGVNCSAAIPDSTGLADGVLSSTLNIPSTTCGGFVSAVTPTVDISHSWVGDLTVTLTGPDATSSTLVTRPLAGTGSCASDDIVGPFQDGGGAFACSPAIPANGVTPIAPATALAPFTSATLTGTWTLQINDAANSNIGSLNGWSVNVVCAALPAVTITATDATGYESGDPIVFQVTRSSLTPAGPLTVNITLGGTATNVADYTAVVPVTIPDGQLSVDLVVTPLADVFDEPAETVIATVAPGTGYTVGTPSSATGVIAAAAIDAVPTLSTYGIIIATMLLAAVALFALRGMNG